MFITCLDLEGVLAPEIWIEFAEARNLPELKITTRDEPDYDKLMKFRLDVLKKNNLGLKEIQQTISEVELLPGAKDFLDELRSFSQVIIISDTFTQFANPIMDKLAWPTIMCNELIVDHDGIITGYRMRVHDSKVSTVKALQTMGYDTIAAGDSYNDVGMIRESKGGFLFRSTEGIKAENPDIPATETYDELLAGIRKIMNE
ncbi:MAG: bifunctional phosphoserine phosphatase/homoserine phosphotransferase ThrH [Firmicutes bacterium]|nr:bifunctional phosphoserine phosphatase/homoserine phosphotransferase ThrH [Bacillota bacterium]